MPFAKILHSIQTINTISRSLVDHPAFAELNVAHPDTGCYEARFMRLVTWFYCLYFESGKTTCSFVTSLVLDSILHDIPEIKKNIQTVRNLRTELYHNLTFSSDSDKSTRSAAEKWKKTACRTVVPTSESDWEQCCDKLICEVLATLYSIEKIVRHLEKNQHSLEYTINKWRQRIIRKVEPHQFDTIINEVKWRIGRDSLDIVKFRNKHMNTWNKRLDELDDGYDFERQATLLIEHTLLTENPDFLPITGKDIMEKLHLKAGIEVGELLSLAKSYFKTHNCSKHELLNYIEEQHLNSAKFEEK